jgi:geranylgeranylglycerol-phosphate geranylgeranyltransferase
METTQDNPKKNSILASIIIMRPINCIMGSLSIIIGILNTRAGVPFNMLTMNLFLGILTYFFIAGSGMIINDIYDLEIDKINRPNRPLPSGSLSLKSAKLLYVFTLGIGLLISILNSVLFNLGFINVILAAFFGFIGWLYAAWGKKQGFFGNIIVSISFSIGLIYGAILNGVVIPPYIYFFFLTSFFLLLSREVVKGCEDLEGDKEEGVKTLAITLGITKAMIFAIIFEISAIIFFILPLFTEIINPFLFTILLFPGIAIVGIAFILSLVHGQEKAKFSKISLLLKVGAFVGLMAFIFASL